MFDQVVPCNVLIHTIADFIRTIKTTSQTIVRPLGPAWISNHIHYKLCDEITYPFLNFNGCTVEV